MDGPKLFSLAATHAKNSKHVLVVVNDDGTCSDNDGAFIMIGRQADF